MAKNNAGTLVAVVIGGVLIYMLLKNNASKAAAGKQTPLTYNGVPIAGIPTNPYGGFLSKLGLQLPNQFGVATPDIGQGDVQTINAIMGNPGSITDTTGDLSNTPNPFNNFGFSPSEIATGSYT